MLAIRLRVSPCSARCSRSSDERSTSTCRAASSYRTAISGRYCNESLPRGPSTWIVESASETFTLAGTGTGLRPIRDMILSRDFTTENTEGTEKNIQILNFLTILRTLRVLRGEKY